MMKYNSARNTVPNGTDCSNFLYTLIVPIYWKRAKAK